MTTAPSPVPVSATPLPDAIDLRGRSIDALVLKLYGTDDSAFFRALDHLLAHAPDAVGDAAVILDVADVAAANRGVDLIRVARQLRTRRITPVGIQNGNAALNAAARGAGLALLPPDIGTPVDLDEAEEAADPASSLTSRLVVEPVRSGQRIVAERGDLIVTAPVSPGAELIAAGHIHVYGALRGRALAGVDGDVQARIFCRSLEADLIAIAGLYRVSDDIPRHVWRRPIQAYLDDDTLRLDALT